MRIPGSLTARTSLRAYLPAALAERVQSVISFGTIKGATSLIPADIHSPRALEYDSGIKRRLYDYSPYDSLTGRERERERERERGEKEKEEEEESDKTRQPRRFCYLKPRRVRAYKVQGGSQFFFAIYRS